MNPQTIELLSWIAGIFSATLALFVTIDQLGIRLRRRRSAEFWQQEIAASTNEPDERTFRMLHRQELSKLVASQWVPTRTLYFPVASGIALMGTTGYVAYQFGKIPLGELTWPLTSEAMSYLTLIITAQAVIFRIIYSMVLFFAKRIRVQKDFLGGRDVNWPVHEHDSLAVVLEPTGKPGLLSTLMASMAVVSFTSITAYFWGSEASGNKENTSSIIFSFSAMSLMLFMMLTIFYIISHMTKHSIGPGDLYPPHGDHEKAHKQREKVEKMLRCTSRKIRRPPWDQ